MRMVIHIELKDNIIHLMGHGPIKKYRYIVNYRTRYLGTHDEFENKKK